MNNNSARVTSAIRWIDDASTSTVTGPQVGLASRYPATANTSGPVTFRRANAPEVDRPDEHQHTDQRDGAHRHESSSSTVGKVQLPSRISGRGR